MPQPNKIHYDAASALSQGRRDRQEDAVAVDFPVGAPHGFAVLADGMGGHAAGDVASQIVVT
ncbi:MAG: serine/threonine-protein phosphatase, partial [Pseudomonadota bacterium]